MKQHFAVLFFLLGITCVRAQQFDDASRNFYYQRYETAKKILRQLVQHNSNPGDAGIALLGEVYLKQKQTDSAFLLLQQAFFANEQKKITVKDAPLTAVAWAHALLDSGRTAEARKLMEETLKQTKYKNTAVLVAAARANTDSKNGDAAWALELLEKAQKRDKKNAEVYLAKGDIYRKIADGGNAVINYAAALNYDPSLAETKYKEGLIYKTQNNTEVMLNRFTEAVQIDSAYAPALYQLYAFFFYTDVNKAASFLQAYLRNTDPLPEHQYMITDLNYVSKKYAEAIKGAGQILETEGGRAPARLYKLMAYSYAASGDSASALEKMNTYFTKQDSAGMVAKDFALMARLLENSGSKAAASAWYRKAVAAETDAAEKLDYMVALADIEKEQNNREQEAVWREAIFRNKPNVTNLDIYKWGTALYAAGNYTGADTVFALYELRYPDQVYGYLWRAKSNELMDTGMVHGLAVPHYLKLIEVASADSLKNKTILLNAYGYLGAYEANIKKDYRASLEYFEKILALDPGNTDALKFTATLKRWADTNN